MRLCFDRIVPVLVLMLTSGCSIAMALSGNPQPNFDAFDVGSTRKQVEIQLGPPVNDETLDNGNVKSLYAFEVGNSPNGHRAAMNFYIDLATLFLWEIPGTIIEGTMGEDQETFVVYDKTDRVVRIGGYRPPEPSQELQEARDAQKQHH